MLEYRGRKERNHFKTTNLAECASNLTLEHKEVGFFSKASKGINFLQKYAKTYSF